jgi:hypothetical protein
MGFFDKKLVHWNTNALFIGNLWKYLYRLPEYLNLNHDVLEKNYVT